MKRWIRIAAFALCMMCMLSTAMAAPNAAATKKMVNGNIDFAFSLYSKVKSKTENVVYSPLSISAALQMTAAGAKGNTLKQLQKALKTSGVALDDVTAYNKELLGRLQVSTRQAGAPIVTIANGLFIKEDFALHAPFAEMAKNDYASESRAVNFADPATVKLVNSWINDKTRGKIDKLFDDFDPATALLLLNTVTFDGDWMNEFMPESTYDETFKGAKGDTTVKMMYSGKNKAYYETKKYQAVYLPYKDENLGMIVALPKGKTSVDTMIKDFGSGTKLQRLLTRLAPREVQLSLPRFSAAGEIPLKSALQSLGVKDAFDSFGKGDLSGIAGVKGELYISDVRHKAVIDVFEKGTSAAAVTSVEFMPTSALPSERPAIMTVDHPFFFAVVNRATMTVLFMGVINNV